MLHNLSNGDGPKSLQRSQRAPRVLIYSHDTFGLGHLRRSRAIANRLVQRNPEASIVIISGSPIIGSFEFGDGVDYVRVPGVVKLANGDYTTLSLNLPLDEAVEMREAIILQTARTLRPEWERKGAVDALIDFYDDIWVYGLKKIYEPLAGLDLPEHVRRRVVYTGYLRREVPPQPHLVRYPKLTKGPFVLVTTGGGGDGHELIDWVLSAYETDPMIPTPALLVFGPFIPRDRRGAFLERITASPP